MYMKYTCYVEISVSEWNSSHQLTMIYLFFFQHAVVVKFHRNDCLVRQYRACGIDSLGLGITCIFYHCTTCTSRHDLVSFAIPICDRPREKVPKVSKTFLGVSTVFRLCIVL